MYIFLSFLYAHKNTHMKKLFVFIAVALFSIMSVDSYAQKIKQVSGSLGSLKSVSEINVIYDYSDMRVGKFPNEADYIAKKKADYNKKEAGRGDTWEKSWVADRDARFHPQFEELFTKHSGIKSGSNSSAKYTLIVKVKRTEPGFNIHVMRKYAEIDCEILLVETANQAKVISKTTVTKAPGRTYGGYDYDSGTRVQEAYAMAGKAFGKYVKKKTKK